MKKSKLLKILTLILSASIVPLPLVAASCENKTNDIGKDKPNKKDSDKKENPSSNDPNPGNKDSTNQSSNQNPDQGSQANEDGQGNQIGQGDTGNNGSQDNQPSANNQNEKADLIKTIELKVSEIQNYLKENTNQNPEIKSILEKVISQNTKDNVPSISLSKEILNQKILDLSKALEDAKALVKNMQDKVTLDSTIKDLEIIKNLISSHDRALTDLKTSLVNLIQEAREILNNEEVSKYVSETQKINDAIAAAKKKIDEFKKSKAAEKLNHTKALQAANDLLNSLKSYSNKENLGSVIEALKQAINVNSNIEDNSPLTDIEAKVNALNQAIEAANAAKAQADSETNEKLAQLKSAIDSANELSDQMSDATIANAKEKLSNAIATAQQAYDANPKQTNEQIERATSAINAAKQEAQTALDNLNKEKSALKQQINANEEAIKNYINNTLSDPKYAEIKKDLQAALDNFNNVQKPLLDNETKAKLEEIKNQLNTALEAAKEKKTEKDKEIAGLEKAALENAIKASKSISNNITSQDPEMIELKNKLEVAQAEAQKVVDGNQEQNYASKTAKINALNEEAQAAIAKFNDKLSATKTTHAETLKAANDLLNNLKLDSNKANLGSVINELTQAINANASIHDDLPLGDITDKKQALNKVIISTANKKSQADTETNEKLAQLKSSIDSAKELSSQMSDEAIADAKQELDKTIKNAQTVYELTIKESDANIDTATASINVTKEKAQKSLDTLNQEKFALKQTINAKVNEIQAYINNDLSDEKYADIKVKLQILLNDFNENHKNSLDSKMKTALSELNEKLTNSMLSAQNNKDEVEAKNTESLNKKNLKGKINELSTIKNSITSHEPVMVELKESLGFSISHAETILNQDNEQEYSNEISKLDNVKNEANKKIKDFNDKLNVAIQNYNSALSEVKQLLSNIDGSKNQSNDNMIKLMMGEHLRLSQLIIRLKTAIKKYQLIDNNSSLDEIYKLANALIHLTDECKLDIKKQIKATLKEIENSIGEAKAIAADMTDPYFKSKKEELEKAITKSKKFIESGESKSIYEIEQFLQNFWTLITDARILTKSKEWVLYSIKEKIDKIKSLMEELANHNEYSKIKEKLANIFTTYEQNDKNKLENMTFQELSTIDSNLSDALNNAREQKMHEDIKNFDNDKNNLTFLYTDNNNEKTEIKYNPITSIVTMNNAEKVTLDMFDFLSEKISSLPENKDKYGRKSIILNLPNTKEIYGGGLGRLNKGNEGQKYFGHLILDITQVYLPKIEKVVVEENFDYDGPHERPWYMDVETDKFLQNGILFKWENPSGDINDPNIHTILPHAIENTNEVTSFNLPNIRKIYPNFLEFPENANIDLWFPLIKEKMIINGVLIKWPNAKGAIEDKNVEYIYPGALNQNTKITSVSFPNAKRVGFAAFDNATNLISVNLPKALVLEGNAFSWAMNLSSINIPNVKSIEKGVFENAFSLTSIDLPNVTKINARAFRDAVNLTHINLPKLEEIGIDTFTNTPGLGDKIVLNGILVRWDNAGGHIIDDKVTAIADNVFESNTHITSVSFPNVTKIGSEAFAGASNLSSVDFSKVTEVGRRAFWDVPNVTNTDFPMLTKVGEDAFSKIIENGVLIKW
ncbi:leucine-rich repeat protein, partial [Metamycoplasma neophronis]